MIDGIAAALGPGSSDGLARLLAATTVGLMGGGASPADARALATLERVEEPDATATCAICLDDLNCLEAAPVARLPRCSHAFHEACLLPWLRDCRGTCPICRTPLAEPTPPPAHAEPPIGSGPFAAGQLAGGISRATERVAPWAESLAALSPYARSGSRAWAATMEERDTLRARSSAQPTAPSHTDMLPAAPTHHWLGASTTGAPDEIDHMSEVRALMGAAYHFAGANATADRPALARQRAALAAHYERHQARRSEREALLRERTDEIYERERRLEQAADSIREAASTRTADAFDDAMAAAGLRAVWEGHLAPSGQVSPLRGSPSPPWPPPTEHQPTAPPPPAAPPTASPPPPQAYAPPPMSNAWAASTSRAPGGSAAPSATRSLLDVASNAAWSTDAPSTTFQRTYPNPGGGGGSRILSAAAPLAAAARLGATSSTTTRLHSMGMSEEVRQLQLEAHREFSYLPWRL